jgi:hypothetical protein
MDFLVVFSMLLIIVGCLFIYFCLIVPYHKSTYYKITKKDFFKLRADKGALGEYMIYERLKYLEADGGRFLFNLYIPKGDKKTTEIDVLLLHPKGIFVFESKNYSGWIYGNETQNYWTQVLPGRGNSHKNSFYNPILQNDTHIRHLFAIIGTEMPTYSVVTFSNHCVLKNISVQRNGVFVLNNSNIGILIDVVRDMTVCDALSPIRIERIYNKLYPYTQTGEEVKITHIQQIEERRNQIQLNPNERIKHPTQEGDIYCPKCGAKLVLRTAKNGENAGNQFYGCSNYPRCRYILSSKNDFERR